MRQRKKTVETIIGELLNSLKESKDGDKPDLDETTMNTKDANEVITIIKRYDRLVKIKIVNIISIEGKQGQLLKRFKEAEDFFETVGFSGPTIYFKINL